MTDKRDQVDDPIESELRTWFKATRTPPAPPTLRAFAAHVAPGARPTTPVRRFAIGWRQAPGNRLAAAATAIAILIFAAGLLVVSGQHEVASPSPLPSASAGPSGPASIGPSIGTPSKLGEHSGAHVALATTVSGAIVAVTPGKIDGNGVRSCAAGVFGLVTGQGVTWADAPAQVLSLASTSSDSGPIGLGTSADCTQTLSILPDGTGGFSARPVDQSRLISEPAFFATSPTDSTLVAAWQTDALKGGFVFWSTDGGRTWRGQTAARPLGWDAAGRFWSIAEGNPGGPLELVGSQGPGFSGTRTGTFVNTTPAAIDATAIFRDRILVARSSAAVLSVPVNGGTPVSLSFSASSVAAGTRFVAAVGKDMASGRAELAISTDGVRFESAPLPDEFAASDPGLLHVAALDDRVILTNGPSAGLISVWSVPITDLPPSPPTPTPIPTAQIPTQPPAQVTSTWTKVTLPEAFGQPFAIGGAGSGISALPGGGFIDFAGAAPNRTVVLTSPDGSTWTRTGEITGKDALGVSGPVAFNGHVYVALGGEGGGPGTPYAMQSNGAAWVSSDLAHWTKAPAQAGLSGAIFAGIAAGSADFVAIGNSEGGGATVWTSGEGLRWQPFLAKTVFPFDLSEATGIAATSQGLVIVGRIGEEAAAWTSPDGRTWTVHSPLPPGSGFFNGIANGPAGFVSLASAPSAGIEVAPGDFRAPVTPWTSRDGVIWHAGPSSPALFGTNAAIVGAPGGYLAVGTTGLDVTEHLWSSSDGTNWVPVAGVDLGNGSSATLVSDDHHVLLWFSGPSGLELLVSDGVHR
jgi:hypothetical protein